jgi:hypothetical protein
MGNDHAHTLASINNVGILLHTMGRYAEAEPYYREALEGNRRVLGDEHPHTQHAKRGLAGTLIELGATAMSEEVNEQGDE